MIYIAELTGNAEVIGKGIMLGAGMIGTGIGVGLIGNAVMNAVGRTPEAAKFCGQIWVFFAIVGLMAFTILFCSGKTAFSISSCRRSRSSGCTTPSSSHRPTWT